MQKRSNLLQLFISGMGGLLYGIDVGVIAAALLYLNLTINLTEYQTSFIVAAVLGGSMFASLVAGVLSDWFGRKKMMIVSGLLFVLSVGIIYISQGFVPLLAGRLLQGFSGGFIAVVIPLYLAESLPSNRRGSGIALFQFMLTLGIAGASLIGLYYTTRTDASIKAAVGDPKLTAAAANQAWRGMYLAVVYPGIVFMLGTFFLSESPRWLFRRGRREQAFAVICKSLSPEQAEIEIREIETVAAETVQKKSAGVGDSLLQRKYVVPFILACIILGCNQTTGINSVLQYVVVILKQAGLSDTLSVQGSVMVTALNSIMTLAAVALIDRKGRKFLLKIGTAGIIVSLVIGALVYFSFESKRIDVREKMALAIKDNALAFQVNGMNHGMSIDNSPMQVTVLYRIGGQEKVVRAASNDHDPFVRIAAFPNGMQPGNLVIRRAQYGPVPTRTTGYLVLGCLLLFIASFSIGPGICVWLALSELLPTRIRSVGMGIALLINQGISTGIAAVFLPMVGNHGYSAMFLFWASCTVVYFVTVTFFLPETKGRTLEQVEEYFSGNRSALEG